MTELCKFDGLVGSPNQERAVGVGLTAERTAPLASPSKPLVCALHVHSVAAQCALDQVRRKYPVRAEAAKVFRFDIGLHCDVFLQVLGGEKPHR